MLKRRIDEEEHPEEQAPKTNIDELGDIKEDCDQKSHRQ